MWRTEHPCYVAVQIMYDQTAMVQETRLWKIYHKQLQGYNKFDSYVDLTRQGGPVSQDAEVDIDSGPALPAEFVPQAGRAAGWGRSCGAVPSCSRCSRATSARACDGGSQCKARGGAYRLWLSSSARIHGAIAPMR